MLPRYLGIVDGYLLVLKTDPTDEDISIVKSCSHLSTLCRMTKFKKNAQLVALYFENNGVETKKGAHTYQLQERDDFIARITTSMEQLAALEN